MKTHTIKTYGITELNETAFRLAIDNNREWNLFDNWLTPVYDDAKEIGLNISSFDLYRKKITGELLKPIDEVLTLILTNHGENTPTHKLAREFEKECSNMKDSCNADLWDDNFQEITERFLKALTQNFLELLIHGRRLFK